MIYCTECGTPNPDGTQVCINCKTELPVVDNVSPESVDHLSSQPSYTQSKQPSIPLETTDTSWWQRLRPDWKAAIVFYAVWWVLNTLSTVTAGAACIFSFPFIVAASLLQGIYVAKLASRDSRYTQAVYWQLGALSGLWFSLMDILTQVTIFAIMAGATLGGAVAILPIFIVKLFGTNVTATVLMALGSELYRRQGGQNLTRTFIVVGLIGTAVVCVLMGIVVAILSAVGISVIQQFGG